MSAVTREDAISFLETACRNWRKMPKLSEEDIGDVATALLRFVSIRSGGEEKNGVGAGLIDSMSDEEFNRDRSDESPNVGKVDHIADAGKMVGVKIDAVDRDMIERGDRIGAKLVRSLLAHYDANTDLSLRAENERLRKERDAALEAEDEAKECYWAVYPTYVAVHGEGMSAEAAHTELSARATAAEAKLEEAAKVLEEVETYLDGFPEFHQGGMGCGLEDRSITDRYEAMRYGWDEAMDRVYVEHITPASEAAKSFLSMKAKAAEILESYGIKSGAYDLGHDLLHQVLSLSQSLRSQVGVSEADVAMTPEEHRLEDLKQMARYSGPIVSFEVREPYYLASCDKCGWVGSSGACGTDSGGDDSDAYCPRCHASGADCGKVAEAISGREKPWNDPSTAPKDGTLLRLLVEPDPEAHTSFEDSEFHYETIGFSLLADTGDDDWHFAGWDWSHDCITQGHGEIIGWLPFARPAPIEVTEEMVERLAKFITEECYGYSWDGLRKDGRVTDRGFKTFRYDSFGGKAIQGTQNDLRDVARNVFAALELDKQPISSHIQPSDGETP